MKIQESTVRKSNISQESLVKRFETRVSVHELHNEKNSVNSEVTSDEERVGVVRVKFDEQSRSSQPIKDPENSPKSILKASHSDAFSILNKHSFIPKQDHYEFENRLRSIVTEILTPTQCTLKDITQNQLKIKSEQEKMKTYLTDSMDWVRSLGDANQVSDQVNRRINDIEHTTEFAHNILTQKVLMIENSFSLLKQEQIKTQQMSMSMRNSSDLLQEEYCKLVNSINLHRKNNQQIVDTFMTKNEKLHFELDKRLICVESLKSDLFQKVEASMGQLQDEHRTVAKQLMQLQNDFKMNVITANINKKDIFKEIDQFRVQLDRFSGEISNTQREISLNNFYIDEILPQQMISYTDRNARFLCQSEEQLVLINEMIDLEKKTKLEYFEGDRIKRFLNEIQFDKVISDESPLKDQKKGEKKLQSMINKLNQEFALSCGKNQLSEMKKYLDLKSSNALHKSQFKDLFLKDLEQITKVDFTLRSKLLEIKDKIKEKQVKEKEKNLCKDLQDQIQNKFEADLEEIKNELFKPIEPVRRSANAIYNQSHPKSPANISSSSSHHVNILQKPQPQQQVKELVQTIPTQKGTLQQTKKHSTAKRKISMAKTIPIEQKPDVRRYSPPKITDNYDYHKVIKNTGNQSSVAKISIEPHDLLVVPETKNSSHHPTDKISDRQSQKKSNSIRSRSINNSNSKLRLDSSESESESQSASFEPKSAVKEGSPPSHYVDIVRIVLEAEFTKKMEDYVAVKISAVNQTIYSLFDIQKQVVQDIKSQLSDQLSQNEVFKGQVDQKIEKISTRMQETADRMSNAFVLFDGNERQMEEMRGEFGKMQVLIQDMQEEANQSIKTSYRHKRELSEGILYNKDRIIDLTEQSEFYRQEILKIHQSVESLRKAQLVDLSLYEQDIVDRNHTQLYGIQEELFNKTIKPSESPIQINQNCVQCSGNAWFVKKAFKMACLAYKSSKVLHQEKLYTREELLEIRKQFLNPSEIESGGASQSRQLVTENEQRDIHDLLDHVGQTSHNRPDEKAQTFSNRQWVTLKSQSSEKRPMSVVTQASSTITRNMGQSLTIQARPQSRTDLIRQRTARLQERDMLNQPSKELGESSLNPLTNKQIIIRTPLTKPQINK